MGLVRAMCRPVLGVLGRAATNKVNCLIFQVFLLRYNRGMDETIFTKIVKGEIPSHKVYEDEKTFAFLDIYPTNPGHVLVIPKAQVEFIWDLSAEDYAAVMETVQKVGRRIREVLQPSYVGVEVIGVDVPHAHVQVIPFEEASELRRHIDRSIEPDHEALAAMAEKLRF